MSNARNLAQLKPSTAGLIETTNINDAAVTTAKMADGAVATVDIADAAITATKLSGAQSGTAPIFGARAWAVFSGTTPTILASGNVSGIVRNAVGIYTITFATSMPSVNYAVVGTANRPSTTGNCTVAPDASTVTKTISQIRIRVANSADGATDATVISVAIFI